MTNAAPFADIFIHLLSGPEHVWLDFFRSFFQQDYLAQNSRGEPIVNRFNYDPSKPNGQRSFEIEMATDQVDRGSDVIPALVIEDLGAVQLGLTAGNKQAETWSPADRVSQADQFQFTYVIHCMGATAGEASMLASIVANAIIGYRRQILNRQNPSMVKINPLSIGAPQPMSTAGGTDCVDRPIQITFTVMSYWDSILEGKATAEEFRLQPRSQMFKFVNVEMSVGSPEFIKFVNVEMGVSSPNLERFIGSEMAIEDPVSASAYLNVDLAIIEPVSSSSFVNAQMKVR